jgi:hypothetical protein
VGFFEDAEEMVASADSDNAASPGTPHCIYGGKRRRAIRLYAVLMFVVRDASCVLR